MLAAIYFDGEAWMHARSISYTFDMVKLAFYMIIGFDPNLLLVSDHTFVIFEWVSPHDRKSAVIAASLSWRFSMIVTKDEVLML